MAARPEGFREKAQWTVTNAFMANDGEFEHIVAADYFCGLRMGGTQLSFFFLLEKTTVRQYPLVRGQFIRMPRLCPRDISSIWQSPRETERSCG
jgi:hypothetical protein